MTGLLKFFSVYGNQSLIKTASTHMLMTFPSVLVTYKHTHIWSEADNLKHILSFRKENALRLLSLLWKHTRTRMHTHTHTHTQGGTQSTWSSFMEWVLLGQLSLKERWTADDNSSTLSYYSLFLHWRRRVRQMSECVYVFQRVYCRYVSQTLLRVMYAQAVSKNMRLCGFAAALFMCLCVWAAFLSLWAWNVWKSR